MPFDSVTNIAEFTVDMRRASDTMTKFLFVIFFRKVSLDFLKAVVQKNPVLTGYSQNNWQVAVGRTNENEVDRDGMDVSLTVADAKRALKQISFRNPYVIVYVWNNVPYIIPLEAGSSRQAPKGFVRQTLRELKATLKSLPEVDIA